MIEMCEICECDYEFSDLMIVTYETGDAYICVSCIDYVNIAD